MNIARALKQKNRIVGEMNKAFAVIQKHNMFSRKVGDDVVNGKEEAVKAAFASYLELTTALIEIKAKIQAASAPIAAKLVALAEQKSLLGQFAAIPVKEGVAYESGGFRAETTAMDYLSVIGEAEIQELSKLSQEQINNLQDEIDEFNATTQI